MALTPPLTSDPVMQLDPNLLKNLIKQKFLPLIELYTILNSRGI